VRLFFAIALDEPVRAEVAGVADALQRRLAGAKCGRAVKWVERENLHVTLRFLGEVDEDRARALIASFTQPLTHTAFDLSVGAAGAFPEAGAPRVLWIGAGSGAAAVRAVFDEAEQRIGPLGFEPEPRGYTPHVTLGRVRDIDRARGRELREWLSVIPRHLATQHVAHVTLYRSHLSPAGPGPRYEVMAEVPLS
jgi:RNA 2',3'-cyclic 3'-phosphodiesterase